MAPVGAAVPCGKRRCECCLYRKPVSDFSSKHNLTEFTITGKLTCQSDNIVYLIQCKRCDEQYVGETSRPLKTRLGNHVSNIRLYKDTAVAQQLKWACKWMLAGETIQFCFHKLSPPYKFLDPPLLPSSLSSLLPPSPPSPLGPARPPFLPVPPLPIPSHECRKKSGKLHAIPYHQQKSSPLENIPGALTFCVPPRVAHWKIWGRIFVIFGLIFTEIHTRTNSTQGIY